MTVDFADDEVVMHQGRHVAIRIEREVFRPLLVAAAQVEMFVLVGEVFLGEAEAHLLRTYRHVVVIERERHDFSPRMCLLLDPVVQSAITLINRH